MRISALFAPRVSITSRNESVRFFSVSRPSAHTGRARRNESYTVRSGLAVRPQPDDRSITKRVANKTADAPPKNERFINGTIGLYGKDRNFIRSAIFPNRRLSPAALRLSRRPERSQRRIGQGGPIRRTGRLPTPCRRSRSSRFCAERCDCRNLFLNLERTER